MQAINFENKSSSAWDERAASLNKNISAPSVYSNAFLSKMNLAGVETVLDIGCGPGVLALKIARFVKHVYCLDYSKNMLHYLQENAKQQQITNVTTVQLDIEASGCDVVPVFDVVVCSRACLTVDLEALILKMNRYAKQVVYFLHLVGGRFDYPQIAQLLEKSRQTFPDYIYAVNILYQLGFDPDLSFVTTSSRLADCQMEEDFLCRMAKQYDNLSVEDKEKLSEFYKKPQLI